jgi:hypothetical protein
MWHESEAETRLRLNEQMDGSLVFQTQKLDEESCDCRRNLFERCGTYRQFFELFLIEIQDQLHVFAL